MTAYDLDLTRNAAKEMVDADPAHEIHAVYLMLAALLRHASDEAAEAALARHHATT